MRLEYFEMVDHVEELDLDAGTIRTVATVPDSGPVFEGHFPGHPLLPGVLMLELINQAAGFMLYLRLKRERMVFLGSVRRARFRRMVKPGTAIDVRAKLASEGPGFFTAEGRLLVAGEVAADADIVLIAQDFPSSEARAAMVRHTAGVTFSEAARPA